MICAYCVCVCVSMNAFVRALTPPLIVHPQMGRTASSSPVSCFIRRSVFTSRCVSGINHASGQQRDAFCPEGCACSQTQTHALRGPALLHPRPSHSDLRVRWRGRAPISSHPGGGAGKGAELPADAPAQSCGHGVPLRQSGGVDQRHLDLCRFAPSS